VSQVADYIRIGTADVSAATRAEAVTRRKAA